MDVACSTACFSREPLDRALRHIADLEFSRVDLVVAGPDSHVPIDDVVNQSPDVVRRIRQGPTIGFAAISLRIPMHAPEYGDQVEAAALLAKQLAAPVVVVDASPSGSSVESEVRRLGNLIKRVSLHGCTLAVVTRTGTMTEFPDMCVQLCTRADGLGLALDPSHFICGPHQGKPFDQVYPHVRHVHLRDTGRRIDQLQVKIGRGEIEYGRIVTSLKRYNYTGALTVAIEDTIATDFDVESEVRKLNLVLESLL